MCMLSGSIVRVWGALESVLARYEGVLSKSDRTMRVVRVDFGDATSLIGMRAALSLHACRSRNSRPQHSWCLCQSFSCVACRFGHVGRSQGHHMRKCEKCEI